MPAFKSFKRKLKYGLIYYLVRFLISISNRVPRTVWLRFCGRLGKLVGHLAARQRALAVTHLTLALGNEKTRAEIEKISWDMFTMLGKNAGDVLRASGIDSLAELDKFVVMKGMEHYELADKKGKGVVFVA